MEIIDLTVNNIIPDMLLDFNHHQIITKKWVYNNNRWELVETTDLREWSKEKRIWITEYLRQQIERGGSAVVVFYLNMGCEDAKDIISEYIDTENDRYLEYSLTT